MCTHHADAKDDIFYDLNATILRHTCNHVVLRIKRGEVSSDRIFTLIQQVGSSCHLAWFNCELSRTQASCISLRCVPIVLFRYFNVEYCNIVISIVLSFFIYISANTMLNFKHAKPLKNWVQN